MKQIYNNSWSVYNNMEQQNSFALYPRNSHLIIYLNTQGKIQSGYNLEYIGDTRRIISRCLIQDELGCESNGEYSMTNAIYVILKNVDTSYRCLADNQDN